MPDTPAPHIDYTPPPGSHPFTDAERRQIYAHQGLQRLITANQRKGWMLQLVTRHGIAIDEASITTIRRIVHRLLSDLFHDGQTDKKWLGDTGHRQLAIDQLSGKLHRVTIHTEGRDGRWPEDATIIVAAPTKRAARQHVTDLGLTVT